MKIILDEEYDEKRDWEKRTKLDVQMALLTQTVYMVYWRVDNLMKYHQAPQMTAESYLIGGKPLGEQPKAEKPREVTDEEYREFISRRDRMVLATMIGDERVLQG